MSDNNQSKGKKNRKYGRNKVKCDQYRRLQLREQHKAKRILFSNGWRKARAYCYWKNIVTYWDKLVAKYHIDQTEPVSE
jgi:hypothetical protein